MSILYTQKILINEEKAHLNIPKTFKKIQNMNLNIQIVILAAVS